MSRRVDEPVIDQSRTRQLGLSELVVLANLGDNLTFYVQPRKRGCTVCPRCGCSKTTIHMSRVRKLRDILPHAQGASRFIELDFSFRSYCCSNCKYVFSPVYQFAAPKARLTRRLEDFLVRESFNRSFESVSHITNQTVSPAAIKLLIDRWIQEKDQTREHPYTASTLGLLSYQSNQTYGILVLNIDDEHPYLVDVLSETGAESMRTALRQFEISDIQQIVLDLTETSWEVMAEKPPHIASLVDPGFFYNLVQEQLYDLAKKDTRWLPMPNKLEVIMTPQRKILATQQYTLKQILKQRPKLSKMYHAADALYDILVSGWSEQLLIDWANQILTNGPSSLMPIAQRMLDCMPNILLYEKAGFPAMKFSTISEQITGYTQKLRPCSSALEKARLLYLIAPDTIQVGESVPQRLGVPIAKIIDMLKEQNLTQERIYTP